MRLRTSKLSGPGITRQRRWRGFVAAGLSLVAFCGCAGDYVSRTAGIRRAYQSYNYNDASNDLRKEVKSGPEIDRLLALMDLGMVLHDAGKYEESIGVLAEADRLSQQLDVVSISEEAKVLLTNERQKAYRGEDFEKLMISVLQALNYAELGKDEDALVEVRRVNERLRKMIVEEKKPYEQLAIARYVGGVLWEDQGEADSAFIDYQAAEKLQPHLGHLAEPILRLAKETERADAYRELKAKYPNLPVKGLTPSEGQLVVVLEVGLSPVKVSQQREVNRAQGIVLIDVPAYRDRGIPPRAKVSVSDQSVEAVTVTSIQSVAKVHLEDRIGRMIAKAFASLAVKAGVAAGVGAATKSKELGFLTFLLLGATTQADLRSWLSLPAEFQVARFRLPAGRYKVKVEAHGVTEQEVEVRAKRVTPLVIRRY